MNRTIVKYAVLLLTFLFVGNLWAVELKEDGIKKSLTPDLTTGTIKIDGILDEDVWKKAPISQDFKSLSPVYGDTLPEKTEVWTAYDTESLYFAFKCYETDPSKIKTSIAHRDGIQRDDMVGVLIDTIGSRQMNYEFYVNPSGIQWDAITSAVSGSDESPDFVWQSAGKLTETGYQVEIRIPLSSIRYKSGKDVQMGIIFVRSISRLGVTATWPELHAGQTDFNFMASVNYAKLGSMLKLEFLPNFTYGRSSDRITDTTWAHDNDTNFGIGAKYGITSSMTLEATVNPDFSQVESDAFQADVNIRYPIFYTEKRPFFMESIEVLDFGIINLGSMTTAIHTRTIADPGWAAKFSGSSGKLNFSVLAANDRAPGNAWDDGINPDEGKTAFFGIVRAKYNLGSDNSLGILYTGRHFANEKNDVAGVDLKYRFFSNLRGSFSYLGSSTTTEKGVPRSNGGGINAMLQFSTPKFTSLVAYERYDPEFYMATSFQNRTGLSKILARTGPIFNMKIKGMKWLKVISPYIYLSRLHDLTTKMNDTTRIIGVNFGFAPSGSLYVDYYHEKEAWYGTLYKKNYLNIQGFWQITKWFMINGYFLGGDQIYYPYPSFLGTGTTTDIDFVIQPSLKLEFDLEFLFSNLSEKKSKQKVYDMNIYNLEATYQFNKYFFLRGIVRYNDLSKKLLTDVLASFTLIPGTVIHLGYGSVHYDYKWQNNQWVPGDGTLKKMNQRLFFKASYLLRIK